MSRKYVIYDCNGLPDDAMGLILLLQADKLKHIKLLAVTCLQANTKLIGQSAVNMYRILQAADRLDIPIYWGAEAPLIPPTFVPSGAPLYGDDGFGDILSGGIDYKTVVQSLNAVEALYDFVKRYPKEITIIAVGPLTNIALALTMYGEDFNKNVKKLFIMGGNYKAVGNITSAAEFNFFSDPEAAHIVLKKAKCPITVLPLETCIAPDFQIDILEWRFRVLGAVPGPLVTILNAAESILLRKGITNWTPCDAICVAVFLFGKQVVLKEREWNAVVDCNGWLTRGQMLIDHMHEHRNNIHLIQKVDTEAFKSIALWAKESSLARSAFLQNPTCE